MEEIKQGSWMPELSSLSSRKAHGNELRELMVLGNMYLGASLYVGNRIAMTAKDYVGEYWRDDELLTPYADDLLGLYALGYGARNGIDEDKAKSLLADKVDWLRMARQMAFFMTSAHASYMGEEEFVEDFPTFDIYGSDVTVHGFGEYRGRTFNNEFGFVGPDGDSTKLSLGPVNGQFPIREIERAIFAVGLDWDRPSDYEFVEDDETSPSDPDQAGDFEARRARFRRLLRPTSAPASAVRLTRTLIP